MRQIGEPSPDMMRLLKNIPLLALLLQCLLYVGTGAVLTSKWLGLRRVAAWPDGPGITYVPTRGSSVEIHTEGKPVPFEAEVYAWVSMEQPLDEAVVLLVRPGKGMEFVGRGRTERIGDATRVRVYAESASIGTVRAGSFSRGYLSVEALEVPPALEGMPLSLRLGTSSLAIEALSVEHVSSEILLMGACGIAVTMAILCAIGAALRGDPARPSRDSGTR